MAKHQIFLVHGMGDFNDKWSEKTQELIRDTYQNYERLKPFEFDKHFQFREVNYNRFFEERREAWKKKAGEINALLKANGFADEAIGKLMDMASVSEGDDFFRTHVLDVIMYRFMPQIAEQVRRSIQLQILEAISDFPENQTPKWSIIAHSLGTSVVHDTLHAVFTHRVNEQLLSRSHRLSVLVMVSNVSRLLWTDIDFYRTQVRPNPVPTQGICRKYINVQHTLDPFPKVKPFHKPEEEWLDDNAKLERSYEHIQIRKKDITDWNVHGLGHYLLNPRAHVPMFRALMFQSAISNSELSEKQEEYEKARLNKNVRERVIKELDKVKPGALEDWEEITEKITQFRNIILRKGETTSEGEGG